MTTLSLADKAYQIIKERILALQILPGDLLSENELAEELEMSRTPIRNAISRLESEGYVASLKNRGVLIKYISELEVQNMTEAIFALLNYALYAMEHANNKLDLHVLEQYLEEQFAAEQRDDYAAYMTYLLLFQKTIIASVNNPVMIEIVDRYSDKLVVAAYYRYMRTRHMQHYSANQFNAKILRSLQSGNISEAIELVLHSSLHIHQHFRMASPYGKK